jgi:hypothetical protein
MPAESVLAFIVPKLVIQAENAVSDCLYFILSTHSKAADSFINYLQPTKVALPKHLQFATQVMWEYAGGRPDILGKSGEQVFLVIESKFDAPLSKGQPVEYVRYLPKDAGGVLLFIVPSARSEELWQAMVKRCTSARIPLGHQTKHRNGLRTASLQDTHCLALASWENLISTLIQDLPHQSGNKAFSDISQLGALCERLISGELGASPALLGFDDQDKREEQLRLMVDEIAKRIVEADYAKTKGYRATPGPGYYKRYMTMSGRVNWCVEFNTEYWARYGESLIWLSTTIPYTTQADCTELQAKLANSAFRIRDQFLIPLLTTHSHSEDQALEQMTRQAVSVAKKLASISM